MASENAKMVAREVLDTISKGKRVNKGEIIRKNGYSETTSTVPSLVTDTQSYKDTIEPIVSRWQNEIQRIQAELERKDLGEEKYKDLVDSIDKLNKQVQLATGGATDNVAVSNVITFKDFKNGTDG